ncbi:ATP-grasp domain-containing protein [Streptomyces sp. NPDC005574]|uniref:ATP-grasp domain-containing protein n=1 Tax=Streptomyces sp. NPDC005574 TaxID=3156891 RepID=UPI0033AF0419
MHIVLVETTSVRGFDMVAEMADSGIEVSFVTANLDAYRGKPGFELSSRAARILEVPRLAAGDLAGRLRGRLGANPPDGVICRDEVYPFAVAELARDLGVPHESPAAARILGDKAAVRARLAEQGVGSLRWRVAATEAEGLAAVEEIGLPVVVKPTAGGWSVGVSIAWSRADAARALAQVLGASDGRDGARPRALVEEYAVGRHVSAELLVQGERVVLLGFAARLPAPAGQAAELGGHFPARIEQEAAARGFVLDVVRVLGIRSSAVHAELLLTPTGPELIEINARVAGHVVARQMSLALGRSLTRDLVALAVGERVEEAGPPETVVALHQLYSPVDAVVRGGKPVDALTPEVLETYVGVGAGDRVAGLATNHDRFGYVLARGRTGEQAARSAAEAAGRILRSLELTATAEAGTVAEAEAVAEAGAAAVAGAEAVAGAAVVAGTVAEAAGAEVTVAEVAATAAEAAEVTVDGADAVAAGACSVATAAEPGAVVGLSPEDAPCGEHLLVLLGGEDPAERILAALGAVSARVSVVWTGAADGEQEARALWRRQYRGMWHSASTGTAVRAAARLVHAARPVRSLLSFSPSPAAQQLRQGPQPPVTAGGPPPGHTVVVAAHGGDVRVLSVVDERGDARVCPSGLDGRRLAALTGRAVHAVREARLEGVVRCLFPTDSATDSPGASDGDSPVDFPTDSPTDLPTGFPGDCATDSPAGFSAGAAPVLLPGLDAATIDLHDAVHTRSLVCAVADTALGRTPRGELRERVAVQRSLPAPAGRARVIAAPTTGELGGLPGLFRAQVFTAAGRVHDGAGPAVWLRHTVVAADREQAERAARRLERSLVLRTAPQSRTHVLLLDRLGPATWSLPDGAPVLEADRFRLSVLSCADTSGPADMAVRTDLGDGFALEQLALAVHAGHPVHRVAALSERLLEPAARLRQLLGTPGERPGEVERFVDKAVMKRIARRHGIRCADGLLAHSPQDVTGLFDRYGKIVLKPRAASGSQGVLVLSSWPDLQRWLAEEFTPGTHLCEEFVDAPMCHIDAVIGAGEPVWNVSLYERDTMALREGRPLSSATVADPAVRAAAGRLLAQVVDAWQVRTGVLHLEAFVTPGGLTFCEVAARPGGAGVTEAFRATNGVDLRHAKLLADAGENPLAGRREPVAAYAGWTVHYCGGGRLLEYDDSAVAPLAHARCVHARVGDTVPASSFSGTGVSTHVFVHDSHTELTRLLALAEHGVRVVTGPAGRQAAS